MSTSPVAPTFAQDLAFLQQHGAVEVLKAPGGARVALSGAYQGRVMTSAVAPDAPSLGWINRAFIASGQTGTQFDNYGGEDRFWVGPEAGQYGFYFPAESAFTFSAWQVPSALHEGAWTVTERLPNTITYTRSLHLTNYSGTAFDVDVERTVRLLSAEEVEDRLRLTIPPPVRWVGFETINRVTNTGEVAWTKEDGLLSVWILGMFNPFDITYVVLPVNNATTGSVVNDRYFGEVPSERLVLRGGRVLFLCDGDYRSKIGIGPAHARPILGSYSPSAQLLTLVQFDLPEGATDYVNSMWEHQADPYGGDVVNGYNDGPPAPGKPPLGGFYEMETSSPALPLQPGASYTHSHRTIHLTGPVAALDALADTTLRIPVSSIAEQMRGGAGAGK